MKRTVVLAVAISAVLVGYKLSHSEEAAAAAAPATQSTVGDQYQTASYGMGYDLGKSMKQMKIKLDSKLVAQGMEDAIAGADSKVSKEQLEAAMTMVQKEAIENLNAAQKDQAGKDDVTMKEQLEKNIKAGDAYRAENAKKAGVVVTASGLQIETLKAGTGASPTALDKVKVHYTGTLIDGTKFDSSVDRGTPATFGVGEVISGWTEALQTMKVGGKARLVIPPQLAYKEAGGGPIPPNSTLVFEVELLDIVK